MCTAARGIHADLAGLQARDEGLVGVGRALDDGRVRCVAGDHHAVQVGLVRPVPAISSGSVTGHALRRARSRAAADFQAAVQLTTRLGGTFWQRMLASDRQLTLPSEERIAHAQPPFAALKPGCSRLLLCPPGRVSTSRRSIICCNVEGMSRRDHGKPTNSACVGSSPAWLREPVQCVQGVQLGWQQAKRRRVNKAGAERAAAVVSGASLQWKPGSHQRTLGVRVDLLRWRSRS